MGTGSSTPLHTHPPPGLPLEGGGAGLSKRMRNAAAIVAIATTVLGAAPAARAVDPYTLIARYEAEVRAAEPAFAGFSAERGRAFYYQKHPIRGLGAVSCASCHRKDPREQIRAHRTDILCRACHVIYDEEHPYPAEAKKRIIEPFTPAANPERFRDAERVDTYFRTNCLTLLQRACTAQEKGDLITWLLTIEGPAIPADALPGGD